MTSEIFGNKAFTRFWTARCASGFAYHMTAVAVGWQVYSLTGSAFMLGLVGLVEFLPQFLLTLVVGQVADRFDRRRIAGVCQAVEALALLVLLAETAGGYLGLGGIFACVGLIGAARAFETPSLQALLPSLVPLESLPRMLAWSGSVWKTAMILGPAAGGFLFVLGPGVVYALGALVYAGAALAVLSIPGAPGKRVAPAGGLWRSALDGLRFIRRRPVIFGAISLDLCSVLLGGAVGLLPVFARDVLAVGPGGLGALRAAPSLGALAMSLLLTRFPLSRRAGPAMFAAVVVFGLATAVFGLSRSFPLSLAALTVLGASDMISVVIRATLIQIDTPDALRGRVSAVNAVFIGASNQLGDFESGLLAAVIGAVPAVVFGGLGAVGLAFVWMRLFPELLGRDRLVPENP
jgi:MFS family permease